jgi:hypothetical protein
LLHRSQIVLLNHSLLRLSWFGTPEEAADDRLKLLMPFLVKLSASLVLSKFLRLCVSARVAICILMMVAGNARDVRPLVKKRFKIQQRIDLHGDKVKGR